jgi:hypothetical protein
MSEEEGSEDEDELEGEEDEEGDSDEDEDMIGEVSTRATRLGSPPCAGHHGPPQSLVIVAVAPGS